MGPVPIELVQEWDELEPDMRQAIEIKPELVYDYGRENVLPRIGFDPSHFTKRELRLMQSLSDRYKDWLLPSVCEIVSNFNNLLIGRAA